MKCRTLLKIVLFLSFVFLQTGLYAQYAVKGMVQDSSGMPLTGAVIRLKFAQDSIGTTADINGNFTFNNVKFSQFTLTAAFIGFRTFLKSYKLEPSQKEIKLPVITLKAATNNLTEVVVTAATPVRIKEDTVEFNASSFPVREGDAVEEVLKKLPGVAVDKDGNVTTQGKPITKIRLNGKDFFGSEVAAAIQNLPADIVKNLQVIDDYGDQANLTGIKTGEPEKILNINIEEDKRKGYFARSTGGIGNEDRYVANLRANSFNGDRQMSFNGTLNNVNMRGGGGDGITNTKSIGFNYRNDWNEKLSANAGYSFRDRKNNTVGSELSQEFLESFTRTENSLNNNTSENIGHNLWGNVEFKIDSSNYLKISPNISLNNSEGNNFGSSNISQLKSLTVRGNQSISESASANLGTNIFYNHKFDKKGRNFNVYSYLSFSSGDDNRDVQNRYVITDSLGVDSVRNQYQLTDNNNQNTRYGSSFSYAEPIGQNSFLEVNYNWSRSSTSTSRDTRDVDNGLQIANPNLSNNFEYHFTTNRFGLNYRYINEKANYTVGISAQPTVLEGQNISKNISTHHETFNLIPSARFVYKFSKQKTFTLNYNGRSNQPGFNQLQPLTDNSNLQNIVTGNPNLKPEFTHGLNIEYNQSDWNLGHTLFGTFSYNQTQNKIVTTRTLINNTDRATSYTNTDGFYNIRGNYAYSKPFAERKFILTWEGGASLNNNVAFIDNNKNIGKNFLVNQGLEFEINLEDIVDVEFETSYSVNTTRYSQSSFQDRRTNRLMFSLEGRNYFFKDLTLGYDVSKEINRGFNNAAIQNPMIVQLYMEYRFLKGNMGSLRFQGYDLLNQNTGISRDVFDNIIVDRQTNRLGRYFLLSFNLRLRKFGGS